MIRRGFAWLAFACLLPVLQVMTLQVMAQPREPAVDEPAVVVGAKTTKPVVVAGAPKAEQVDPVTVSQSGNSLVWLAMINVVSLALLAVIARWADSRKDNATAKATADAAVLAAKIKADEKAQDWARQDAVAKAVEDTAKRAIDVAAEAVRRQDEVAERVQAAAKQAADAAQLLLEQQQEAKERQDAVANRVQEAALQAQEAAKLLAAAQERMTKATEEVARLAAESDVRVREQLRAIDEQGKKIHILVNSDMTAARKAERDSMHMLGISLKNALALSKKLGLPVDKNDQEEIKKVEKRLVELDQILEDRHQAQLIVEAEAKMSGTPPLPTAFGLTPLERDKASRPSKTIVTDGDRRKAAAAAIAALPVVNDPTTINALKEIVKNTAETAENTSKEPSE